MQECGYRCDSSRVWVVDHDRLILVAVVLDNTLNQYVERSAQEDVICQVPNNMELNLLHDDSNKDWHIVGEA